MSDYRRARCGRMYFFTVVTYDRRPVLCLEQSRIALREAILETRKLHPFSVVAWVLLPDHLHCIWELPESDSDYSTRWSLIKKGFSRRISGQIALPDQTVSRNKHRESTVWQRRFWEHQIQCEQDFQAHCDYIHFNPVKHGLVTAARDWPFSTFHRMVQRGFYTRDWCSAEAPKGKGDWGE